MPKLISRPTKAKLIPRSNTSTQVSEGTDIPTNTKDPEIRITIDPK
jgi:hypothetical protein